MTEPFIPWTCVVVEASPGCWKTTFAVGAQHFTLASSDDPEEGQRHCEFVREMFVRALKKAGMP